MPCGLMIDASVNKPEGLSLICGSSFIGIVRWSGITQYDKPTCDLRARMKSRWKLAQSYKACKGYDAAIILEKKAKVFLTGLPKKSRRRADYATSTTCLMDLEQRIQ
jgi:hypothetical protein